MTPRPLLAAIGLLAALHATPADASTMLGSTATIAVTGAGLTATASPAVIGAGAEFRTTIGVPFLEIDIGADRVTYTAISPTRLGLARSIALAGLAFTAPGAAIAGLDVTVGSGVTGITAANFSFTADSLRFDFTTATFLAGARIVVTLATVPLPQPAAVPEPASLGLLLAGLCAVGLCAAGRRA